MIPGASAWPKANRARTQSPKALLAGYASMLAPEYGAVARCQTELAVDARCVNVGLSH